MKYCDLASNIRATLVKFVPNKSGLASVSESYQRAEHASGHWFHPSATAANSAFARRRSRSGPSARTDEEVTTLAHHLCVTEIN